MEEMEEIDTKKHKALQSKKLKTKLRDYTNRNLQKSIAKKFKIQCLIKVVQEKSLQKQNPYNTTVLQEKGKKLQT